MLPFAANQVPSFSNVENAAFTFKQIHSNKVKMNLKGLSNGIYLILRLLVKQILKPQKSKFGFWTFCQYFTKWIYQKVKPSERALNS